MLTRDEFFTAARRSRASCAASGRASSTTRCARSCGATSDRISVRFEYESHDAHGQWWRSHGNEHWEFDEQTGLIAAATPAFANDYRIDASERRIATEAVDLGVRVVARVPVVGGERGATGGSGGDVCRGSRTREAQVVAVRPGTRRRGAPRDAPLTQAPRRGAPPAGRWTSTARPRSSRRRVHGGARKVAQPGDEVGAVRGVARDGLGVLGMRDDGLDGRQRAPAR